MITDSCAQLLEELEKANSPLIPYFQPGIGGQAVDELLQANNVELQLPDDVYALYGWRNGVDGDAIQSKGSGEILLFSMGVFTSLDISIQNYLSPDFYDHLSAKGLYPLFENFAGDFYLIDADKTSQTYKKIILFSLSNPYIQPYASVFDSLDSCILTIAECYRERAYFFTPDSSYLNVNAAKEWDIWESHNPQSDYYKILRTS